MKIAENARLLIARIIVSCHEMGLAPQEEALVRKAKAEEAISREDFKAAGKYRMYEDMEKLAREMGKKEIDVEIIPLYFGGRGHEKKVVEDIARENMPDEWKPLYLLRHILMPVEIIGRDNGHATVEYVNGNIKVVMEDALVFNGDKGRVKAGGWALFHYASIVLFDPDSETIRRLLEEQKKCADFMEAAKLFDGKDVKIGKMSGLIEKSMVHHGM